MINAKINIRRAGRFVYNKMQIQYTNTLFDTYTFDTYNLKNANEAKLLFYYFIYLTIM